jgi:NAD(P)-dependent dehydrogenase (short-subunit alcohol dehydrogenase family)
MTRGILIAGNDSSLFSALCVEAAKRVETYAAALVPQRRDTPNSAAVNQDSGQDADGDGQNAGAPRGIVLDWNPASPISARTLMLSALNKLEHISDAVLVCVPPAYRKNAADFSPAEVDVLVDNNIKGWFFLVRELTAIFRARRPETPDSPGTLALVMPELGGGFRDDVPDLLGPAASAAFRAFAQGLIASSLTAPYHVLGFSSSESGEENAFAAHIFKTMEEGKRGSGKWHKFGKFGLFR